MRPDGAIDKKQEVVVLSLVDGLVGRAGRRVTAQPSLERLCYSIFQNRFNGIITFGCCIHATALFSLCLQRIKPQRNPTVAAMWILPLSTIQAASGSRRCGRCCRGFGDPGLDANLFKADKSLLRFPHNQTKTLQLLHSPASPSVSVTS